MRPAAERLRALGTRRPGPGGAVLLPLTWVVLGALVVLYIAAILALAFAAVLVATLRLFLTPVLRHLARLPGLRRLRERRRLSVYARAGVAELEHRLQTPPLNTPPLNTPPRRAPGSGGAAAE